MLVVSENVPEGFAKALSLVYEVACWDFSKKNPFDMFETLNPEILCLTSKDVTAIMLKALKEYPFAKLMCDVEVDYGSFCLVDSYFGLDLSKPEDELPFQIDISVCGDYNGNEELMKLVSTGKVKTFGKGWPHTNNMGIPMSYPLVFSSSNRVILTDSDVGENLFDAAYRCGIVYTEFRHKLSTHISKINFDKLPKNTSKKAMEYSYAKKLNNYCLFLNQPIGIFEEKMCQYL